MTSELGDDFPVNVFGANALQDTLAPFPTPNEEQQGIKAYHVLLYYRQPFILYTVYV